MKESMSLQL